MNNQAVSVPITEVTDPLLELAEQRQKIRDQFDAAPYPNCPLEKQPNGLELLTHDLTIPFYLRDRRLINPTQILILDAGCGSGYKSFVLAKANPGVQVVGIDLSEQSVKLASQRFQYHGVPGSTFQALLIEDLPDLGLQFDYINCDEVLYLLPDPIAGLKALKAVLKPTGILRANLHSAHQRDFFFRAQQVFRMMGLLEDNPRELEIEIVRDTMTALKDEVLLKQSTWHSNRADREDFYLMNYLFQGDKGYTVPELFSMLEAADLQFLGMTQWQSWQLQDVFKDAEHWPALLKTKWPTWSTMEQLNLFELLDPLHRLLDFWCGHPEHQPANRMLQDWTAPDWQRTIVYLHPRLKLDAFRQDLLTCFETHTSFHLNDYWNSKTISSLDNKQAAILLKLWQAPQAFSDLLSHWLHICPVNPITLEPTDHKTAFATIVNLLSQLEASCCVLIESQS